MRNKAQSFLKTIIVIWVIVILAISMYGVHIGYLLYYHAALIVIAGLPPLFIAALIMIGLEDYVIKFEELTHILSRWIRNEDIRRDIEVLPFFVEERKKEYLKGLSEGYREAENALKSVASEMRNEMRYISSENRKIIDEMRKSLEEHKEALKDVSENLKMLTLTNRVVRRRFPRKRSIPIIRRTVTSEKNIRIINQILSILEKNEMMKERFKVVRRRILRYKHSSNVSRYIKKTLRRYNHEGRDKAFKAYKKGN
jgi:signal transduction histidine kinase